MKPAILIIGGESTLAMCFKQLYPNYCIFLSKKECDITSPLAVEQAMKRFHGKYVINCAAITDMNVCEENPQACFDVNIMGVYLLNKYCTIYGKKLIHISSNYAVNPPNTYGWSKYLSEKVISPDNLIIRTTFYSKKAFIISNILAHTSFAAYTNVWSNPVSINRLTTEIIKAKNRTGLLNIFSNSALSYEHFAILAKKILALENTFSIKSIKYEVHHQKAVLSSQSIIQSDIKINIENDLFRFKKYLQYTNH